LREILVELANTIREEWGYFYEGNILCLSNLPIL
jgi:hypothetical protein